MHHLLASLGDGGGGHAQLHGYVLALESLDVEHLQDDTVLAVPAIIKIADRIACRRCNKPPGSIRSNTPLLFLHQHL